MPATSDALDLRERRAKIAKEMHDLAKLAQKEDRKFTPEEREKFDRMNEDCTSLLERAEDMEKAERLEREMDQVVRTDENKLVLSGGRQTDTVPADRDEVITNRDVDLALRAYAIGRVRQVPREWEEARQKVGIDHSASSIRLVLRNSVEQRELAHRFREEGIVYRATTAQAKGTNALGGFAVPTSLRDSMEEALLYFGGFENATRFRTASGENLNIATVDDASQLGSIHSENATITTEDISLAQLTLRAHTFDSRIVKSSVEFVQDEAVDFVGFIGRALGARIGRKQNAEYTTGSTATTSPRGINRDSAVGFTATTSSGNVTHTSLTETLHSVDIEYRRMPGAGWMMHDGIVKEVRQIVDSQGNPIWQIGMQTGQPDRLYGFPIFVNNRMTASSTVASGPILAHFGDLGKYAIREVTEVELFRFDEKYMNQLQVGWLAWMRADGRLLVASTRAASKPVKHLVSNTT